ncbi:MAG TPA: hypothetical protein VNO50_17660 [Pyrinomonadaceae bacterium]|nr:hypothetical protein [Pyrinomonadaceae bacterium]
MRYVKTANVLMFPMSLIGFLSIYSSQTFACSCLSNPSGKEALKASRVAFRGTVTNIDYLDIDTPLSEPRIVVTISVSRVWKGFVRKTVVLHTVYNKTTCEGYYFKTGEDYLVFAYPNEEFLAPKFLPAKKTLGTNYCNGTTELDLASGGRRAQFLKAYLREIGKGRQPK